ncbi:chemotaxis protein CheW [Marinospirillum insulare]|uniref:Chemotaxis protein CheW n=1 Tax=Marinospirillum insulare TaxID=217169 RepID=A0ABQ5ZY07_9GAMM|nr:chemotaxis protein CheW [Marinospirillum insulare]GLR63900.1 chemotaxis protein CheW [Marinospirillum insulare]
MSWQDTPQQAIEEYLEALLHDDMADESPEEAPAAQSVQKEESLQARQLSESMLGLQQAPKTLAEELAKPVQLDEPLTQSQVILPNLKLPEAEPEPAVETLADFIQEIETSQEVTQPVEEPKQEEPQVEIEPQQEVPAATPVAAETPAAGQPPSPPGWKDGRPVWAQERFECLLFKVKGLTLAVPLVELGGIIKIDKEPTPLFGQPSWFLGMLRNNNMNVSMVDTAQWVLPPALIEKNQDPYQLIIRIHNSTWGLACNEVDRSISLEPEQVRWRTTLGKRPWLAGTVIEHMCALIDVAAFDRLLKEGHGHLEPANLTALNNLDD